DVPPRGLSLLGRRHLRHLLRFSVSTCISDRDPVDTGSPRRVAEGAPANAASIADRCMRVRMGPRNGRLRSEHSTACHRLPTIPYLLKRGSIVVDAGIAAEIGCILRFALARRSSCSFWGQVLGTHSVAVLPRGGLREP